jgi:hypothetical protein
VVEIKDELFGSRWINVDRGKHTVRAKADIFKATTENKEKVM